MTHAFTPARRAVGESLGKRIEAFLKANPDEEMTLQDIVTKFGCSYSYTKNVMSDLLNKGCVESAHLYRLSRVWKKGRGL